MAPVTRATKPVHRKQNPHNGLAQKPNNPDSWELVQHKTNQDDLMDISPLRDMADRVGREVDHFAETLDKFNSHLHDDDAYDAAYELALEYKGYAADLVQRLKRHHDAQRLHEMKNEFGKRLPQSSTFASVGRTSLFKTSQAGDDGVLAADTSLGHLEQWQSETDTWDLFRIMLELRYNPNQEQLREEREKKIAEIGQLNRYTSDDGLWERFTLQDDVAHERYLVLKWLQGTADRGENDIEAISEELENKAGRGTAFWVNGWMETREKIKGAKRMRVVSAASAAQLDIRRSDSNDPLVSQLDPDAPTRQGRVLEKQDAYSERSLWMTCWEMLRRGRSWSEVCDWCSARNQSWRAVSFGASTDSARDVPLPGASAGTLWRRLCYTLATRESADEYEAAVYGLLSGDLDTVKRVSKSWDDHLYALYNSLLLTKFDQYLQRNLPDRITSTRFPIPTSMTSSRAIDLVGQLRDNAATAKEARLPMKLIQSSLIADNFEELCFNLSAAISAAPQYNPTQTVQPTTNLLENVIAQDLDALRIVTHMLIMLREVYPPLSRDSAETEMLDNIVAAYIQTLSAAGKRDLAPLYASKISPARARESLAQVLSDVTDLQDKVSFIRLMGVYGIDPISVLLEQSHYLVKKLTPKRTGEESRLRIVEDTADDIYAGQRIIHNFTSAATGSDGLANHFTVFHLVEGHWDITLGTLAFCLRKLLQSGYFLEASELVERLPFESLSSVKSRHILGKAVNVMDREDALIFHEDVEQAATFRLMQKQSQAYYELTLLVRAIDALQAWRDMEYEYANKNPQPTSAPTKLKKCFEQTCAAVEPVFTGILLNAKDDTEASELAEIRNAYLPELVLAYIATLCAAAHLVSRDNFVRSMDLAAVVADSKNGLADTIMAAGRMGEVVTAFASTSEMMLKLNELGKPRREKRNRTGGNLAVWEIGG